MVHKAAWRRSRPGRSRKRRSGVALLARPAVFGVTGALLDKPAVAPGGLYGAYNTPRKTTSPNGSEDRNIPDEADRILRDNV